MQLLFPGTVPEKENFVYIEDFKKLWLHPIVQKKTRYLLGPFAKTGNLFLQLP